MPNPRDPRRLTAADYEQIESRINLTGEEDFVVVSQRRHTKINFSVHVFARQPMTKEMQTYEETASRMKLRGTRADVEGSPIKAAKDLYDKLIVRVYDLRVGRQLLDELDGSGAAKLVPIVVKREAIREFLGGAEGAEGRNEDEGDTESVEDASEGD